MRRPSAARAALRLSPLMKAGGADASRIECVPFIAARARPLVFFAWRPTAQWAADARRFRGACTLLLFNDWDTRLARTSEGKPARLLENLPHDVIRSNPT